MNREELESMLNEMDPEERELVLAADDAYDRLYAYRLHKEFGVTVECNPGGDRSKVVIDGVVMDHGQFAEWLFNKQCMAPGQSTNEETVEVDILPDHENIDYADIDYQIGNAAAVKNYLRDHYNRYLAANTSPTIVWEDDYAAVSNIRWGRRR